MGVISMWKLLIPPVLECSFDSTFRLIKKTGIALLM
jgi:hypothetical protein